ncbi:hypothetical protein EST38_g976 [Candolleomyces aberdarensis]|uniref:Peptidase M24 domain-containing protein n=1 Tax=Candolleomyces aberdarensis TaxID=2316362 RepID=A0A4Q2DXD3_9AGAR|nr:hypothetical protein EST38_g976 [Candolleomyces aberdarensis]
MLRLTIYSIASLVLGPFGLYQDGISQNSVHDLAPHCDHVPPISKAEFDARQAALSSELHKLNALAYVAEPSANSQFFANFSSVNWKLSERPLLLIVRPSTGKSETEVQPDLTILTPTFEVLRARGLPVSSFKNSGVRYISWAEEANPYSTALSGLGIAPDSNGTIYVDSSIRKFIVDGLQDAGPNLRIASAPLEITSLRERKSPAELEILKCANEATVLAIRNVHRQLSAGMHESQVRSMLASSLRRTGLKDGGCLTLFGSNAALPHGTGTDRVLQQDDFALFDCGGSLHGYISDVTRTVALPGARIPEDHLRIWSTVKAAQSAAMKAARAGALTREPDEAARAWFRLSGLDKYFTHRLGHGIGLQGHEQPYLRGGSDDIIQTGHVFSNEPGVYIEDKVGVRLEDCFYIDDSGMPRYLTEGVGGPSHSPWAP